MGVRRPFCACVCTALVTAAVVLATVCPVAASAAGGTGSASDPLGRVTPASGGPGGLSSGLPSAMVPTSPRSTTAVAPQRISSLIVKTTNAKALTASIRQRAAGLAAAAKAGSVSGTTMGGGGASVLTLASPISPAAAVAMSNALEAQPGVEWAEPNWPMHALESSPVVINDPDYSRQWALWDAPSAIQGGYSIRAPEAWQKTKGSASVVVAVIDTGITDHPDLDTQIVKQDGLDYGYDMIANPDISNDGDGRDSDPHDPGDYSDAVGCDSKSSWHGTHVAGIIAAAQNNSIGVSGVAPGVRLEPVRVLGTCGGDTSDVADGIRWAAGGSVTGVPGNLHPAKVINLSLGGAVGTCPQAYQEAIDDARSRGAVVVVAAGNSNSPVSGFSPANCKGVITTVATGRNGSLAYYSDFGMASGDVQIAAPGGDAPSGSLDQEIYSTYNTGIQGPGAPSYGYLQGTSMATPQVSGTVALMLSVKTAIPDQVLAILRATATPFPVVAGQLTCTAIACGAGILDAGAAVAQIAGQAAGTFRPITPVRILDTRQSAPVAAGATRSINVGGRNGIPLNASAISVTVSVLAPTRAGALTVFPYAHPRPGISSVGFVAGTTTAQTVLVGPGVNAALSFFNSAAAPVQVVVDATGYFAPGNPALPGSIRLVTPVRILDTRTTAGGLKPLGTRATRFVTASGKAGVPAGVSAVAVHVTAVAPKVAGSLIITPAGVAQAATTNLSFTAGRSGADLVITKVDSAGRFKIYNTSAGATDVVVDEVGYVIGGTPTAAGSYHALNPTRLLDTRVTGGPVASAQVRKVTPASGLVPPSASGLVTTLTVVSPTASGWLTAYGAAQPLTATSNLTYTRGQTVANLAVTAGSAAAVRNNGSTPAQVLVDLSGYFQ